MIAPRVVDGVHTGCAFPDMLYDVVRGRPLSAASAREEARDLFVAHLPPLRYEQPAGVGPAARQYILRRRELLTSEAQRKPAAAMSAVARQEVEHLRGPLDGATREPRHPLSPEGRSRRGRAQRAP